MEGKYKHPLYEFIVKKQNSNNTTKHICILKKNSIFNPSTINKV